MKLTTMCYKHNPDYCRNAVFIACIQLESEQAVADVNTLTSRLPF